MPVTLSGTMGAAGAVPKIVIQAVLDTSDFEARFDKYLDLMEQGIQAQQDLAQAATQSSKQQEQVSTRSTNRIIKNLKSMRWQIVTFNFFLNKMSHAFRQVFERMEEGAESLTTRLGQKALLDFYKVDPSMGREFAQISRYAYDVQESLLAVNKAVLADQGEFQQHYTELWRSAVAAAVMEGKNADDILVGMTQSLHEGTGAALDQASSMFNASYALQEYAENTGQFAEDLSLATRQQIILNRITERGNDLYDAGADKALEAAEGVNTLKNNWKIATTIFNENITAWDQLINLLDFGVKVFGGLSIATGLYAAEVKGLNEQFKLLRFAPAAGPAGTAIRGLIATIRILTGNTTDEYEDAMERMKGAAGRLGGAAEGAARGIERLDNALSKASMSALTNQLLKYDELMEEHNQRLIDIGTERAERITEIDLRYNKRVQKIERNIQRQRERLIRRAARREAKQREDNLKKLEELERKHQMRMRHNRERFRLSENQSEVMYQYERQVLVARGDVLAIEDLDARYDMEKRARQDNFTLSQRQLQEQFELQKELMRDSHQEQLQELRDNLQEQLDEIAIRRQEQLDDAAEAYKDEVRAAQAHYDDLKREQEESLKEIQKDWANHWVDIADSTELGTEEVANIIRSYLGPGGETEQIITQFIARQQQVLALMAQIRRAMSGGATGGAGGVQGWNVPGIIGGGIGWYHRQYGGQSVHSSPTAMMVGEGYVPEVVSVSHMGTSNVALSWRGAPIPLQASGAQGLDLSGVGDAIAQGLVATLQQAF